MLENPGDELYFGEVYRQILQEAWLPDGGEEWHRLGKSRRGWRPSLRGIGPPGATPSQQTIRRCFSDCSAAWRALPWDNPTDRTCDLRWGKEYWLKEKQDRGLMCSYYDLFMRHCMRFCLDTGCLIPSSYLLDVNPPLTGVQCSKVYDLSFPNACGDISMIAGPGEFVAPNEWVSPSWGTEGILCFQDANGARGQTTYRFALPYWGEAINWPYTNPDEIPWGDTKTIYVAGGIPPYTWSVEGTGFTLGSEITQGTTNSLTAAAWTDPYADITVSDICANPTTGSVEAQPSNWDVCYSFGIGGCCAPPTWPCQTAWVRIDRLHKASILCGTRPSYGYYSRTFDCRGDILKVFADSCPQTGGKLCGLTAYYWKDP